MLCSLTHLSRVSAMKYFLSVIVHEEEPPGEELFELFLLALLAVLLHESENFIACNQDPAFILIVKEVSVD